MIYDRTMTATTYIVDKKQGKLLLHLHKKFGQLYPLGGHIESGELPHEAALREVFEESGLRVILSDQNGAPVAQTSEFVLPVPMFLLHENISSPVQNLDFVYAAFLPENIDPKEKLKPLLGESRVFFWVSPEEALKGTVLRGEKEYVIPGHIKKIAEMVFKNIL